MKKIIILFAVLMIFTMLLGLTASGSAYSNGASDMQSTEFQNTSEENGLKSIAFCCISTGVFMFPNRRAAEIAVKTVRDYRRENNSKIEVVFNVWKDVDREIYRQLLG